MTYPDRQTSEEIAEAWRRVHITAWEFEGNIRPTNWTEDSWVGRASRQTVEFRSVEFDEPVVRRVGLERGDRRDVVRKASTQQAPRLRLSSHGERERHNADGHNFGVKIFQLCSVSSSLSHANFEQPFRNLTNKVRGKIFYKEVFLHASFITASLSSCVCLLLCRYDAAWYCRWLYNNAPIQKNADGTKYFPTPPRKACFRCFVSFSLFSEQIKWLF